MSASSWQSAWDRAQSHLAVIRDSIDSSSSPNPPLIRIGQLDAEQLDEQLVYILREPLDKAITFLNANVKSRFDPEITLLIRLVLYKLSIWNNGSSYGAKLQDLTYALARDHTGSRSSPGLPRRILVLHAALTVLIPYLHARLRAHALSNAWPDAPSSDKRRRIWEVFTAVESSYTLLALLSFVVFLWNGRYRTIADRLLGMMLVPSRRIVRHNISYEFMNRQMIWHAFTEFLLFLLPLVSRRSIQRRVARLTSHLISLLPSSKNTWTKRVTKKRGKYHNLPLDQCAICAEDASYTLNLSEPGNIFSSLSAASTSHLTNPDTDEPSAGKDDPPQFPLNTPYTTSCGHTFCYHCIAERMMRAIDEGVDCRWECLRCAEPVQSADRSVGMWMQRDGSEPGEARSELDDIIGDSDLDISEISGSVRSYTDGAPSE